MPAKGQNMYKPRKEKISDRQTDWGKLKEKELGLLKKVLSLQKQEKKLQEDQAKFLEDQSTLHIYNSIIFIYKCYSIYHSTTF